MTPARRTGRETSETRSRLLDAAEAVMLEDGYAAVSSRRLARDAGVTPALVHYYFPTLDDLFLAMLRRRAEQQLERQQRFLSSPQPLRALWRYSSEPAGTALMVEFMALANHRKSIGSELADYAERFREQQLAALSGPLAGAGLNLDDLPPVVVLVLMAGLSRTLVMEEAIGVSTGLPETVDAVERFLDAVEGPAPKEGRKRTSAKSGKSRPRRARPD